MKISIFGVKMNLKPLKKLIFWFLGSVCGVVLLLIFFPDLSLRQDIWFGICGCISGVITEFYIRKK